MNLKESEKIEKYIKHVFLLLQMDLDWTSFNSGDVFLVDCGHTIFVWNGTSSSRTERIKVMTQLSGQQIRSKIDIFQNANFLISQPNPMMFHSLESSRRDDFNGSHIIGIGWEVRKLSWKQCCSLFLNCSPDYWSSLAMEHDTSLSTKEPGCLPEADWLLHKSGWGNMN